MDFTISAYKKLLSDFLNNDYTFLTFKDYLSNPENLPKHFVILRHDIDRLPGNSLNFGRIQKELGIKGTYYFRIKKNSCDSDIIKHLADWGHEIGYHYEDLSRNKGNLQKAIWDFNNNLKKIREIVQVTTICMHGSPLSRFDNRLLWRTHDYRKFGIIGEPY